MRLVIHSQGAANAGLKRYNGRGIFSSIGRKLFSFGLKKVINAVEKENKQQMIAKALVNGPPLSKKKEKVPEQQKKKRKQKLISSPALPPSKVRKYSENSTNQLINRGSGIVLD